MSILDYFPLDIPRDRQVKSLEYIEESYNKGYRDIVIAAPTGAGKSAIGIAAANWGSAVIANSNLYGSGAYYLVTQKLLQDQLENDALKYRPGLNSAILLKGADSYPCPTYGNCGVGNRMEKTCSCKTDGSCPYRRQKQLFIESTVGITNYAYFMHERKYAGQLGNRKVLICDESHNCEQQILSFIEMRVDSKTKKKWLGDENFPKLNNLKQYTDWICNEYLPQLQELFSALQAISDIDDEKSQLMRDLDGQICQINRSTENMRENPKLWIFWSEASDDNFAYIARPLTAAPFFDSLIGSAAQLRIYMSAYPGVKSVFCRSLGLDPDKVAWAKMSSSFPAANRKIYVTPVGHMSSANKETTIPTMVRSVIKLARHYKDKGVIHCGSYELGTIISNALEQEFPGRAVFPKNADAREAAFNEHKAKAGSIIISPSMSEGFDFIDDLARWQAIIKVAWPYLGDKQIEAKMKQDEEWYIMRTVSTTIQQCGRIVRSQSDYGVTFILDSDFLRLWSKAEYMFPNWWKESLIIKNS